MSVKQYPRGWWPAAEASFSKASEQPQNLESCMPTLHIPRVLSLFITALLFALMLNVGSVTAQVDAALRLKSQQADSITATLSRDGSVRVIVEIAAPIPPASYRQGAAGLASVGRLVEIAQLDVLSTYISGDAAKSARWSTRQISHFPMMAMTVNAAELAALATDSRIAKLWEDKPQPPALTESLPLIGMASAYSNNATGAGTIVAVLDTGVQSSHPFLSGKVTQEACFSTTNSEATTVCPNGQSSQTGTGAGANCSASIYGCDHGTHVAGIAAGKNTIAGNPTNGVAKEAKVFAVQVFSRVAGASCTSFNIPSPCALTYPSDQIAGLSHVLSRVGVIPETIASANMSLGGGNIPGTCDSDPRKTVIDQLKAANVATVISSGNSYYTNAVGAPGCISTAVTVGSTTKSDVISPFSNSSPVVDLLAPGSSINSAVPGGGYSSWDGTSMAAPHVAGAFAAIRSRIPSATVDQIENALKSTGTPVADTRSGGTQTKPRIRVDLALNQLLGAGGPVLAVTPGGNFASSGNVGGPFSPTSTTFTVQNSGSGTMNWTASSSNTGVATVSPTSGSLGAGASTSVTVQLAAGVNSLSIGTYLSTLTFTNSTNGSGNTTRTATLTVNNPGGACTDAFGGARTLVGSSGSINGSNASATGESGEPNHATVSTPLNSVWCKFTAASTGTATFTTIGSNFDTTLAAYTGSSVNALSVIASNDDVSSGVLTSSISFAATAGTTYYIAVDGYSANVGNYTLNYTIPTGPNARARFDFNGDGTSDILWYNSSTSAVGMFRMQNGVPTWVGIGQGGAGWSIVGVGDFNGDGTSDILWYNASSRAVGQFRMANGVPTWVNIGTGSAGWSIAGTGDYNGDGTADILWYNASSRAVGMFRMANGVPTWVNIGTGGAGWSIAGSGDFNGDGTTDILWYHASSRAVGMFRMANGVPTWVNIGTGGAGWSIAGTGDFNGDGTADILWYHASSRAVAMFRMANGVPTWANIGTGSSGWAIAGTGDYNGNGTSDILWYNALTSAVGQFRMANGVPTWAGIGRGAVGWTIAGNSAIVGHPSNIASAGQ